MRYGIIEQDSVYWVVDNISEVYLAGPYLSVHSAEEELAKWTDNEQPQEQLGYTTLDPMENSN